MGNKEKFERENYLWIIQPALKLFPSSPPPLLSRRNPRTICTSFRNKYMDNRVAINETRPIRNSHNSKLSLDYYLSYFHDIFFLINVDNPRLTDFLHASRAVQKYNITNFRAFRVVHFTPWKYRIVNNDSPFHGRRSLRILGLPPFFFLFLIIPATIGVDRKKKK